MPAHPSALAVQTAPPGTSGPPRQAVPVPVPVDRRPASPDRLVRPALLVASCAVAFLPAAARLASSAPDGYPLWAAGATLALSGALAVRRLRAPAPGPAIHDRQVDYIVAVGLLVGAVVLIALKADPAAPVARSWPEVLALPLFCGGVLTLAYGVRVTARTRGALAVLLLAWPPVLVPLARAVRALPTGGAGAQVVGLVVLLAVAGPVALHLVARRRGRPAGGRRTAGRRTAGRPAADAVPRLALALSAVLAVGLLAGAVDVQVGPGAGPARPAVAGAP